MKRIKYLMTVLVLSGISTKVICQGVQTSYVRTKERQVFTLSNNKITNQVIVTDDMLQGDELSGNTEWLALYHNTGHAVYTDGDYALEMMWTDWSAPGKIFNGDLEVAFTKKDYQYTHYDFKDIKDGGKELELYFTPFNQTNTIQLKITYQLLPDKFYSRRKISLEDTTLKKNWLEAVVCRKGKVGESEAAAGAYLMREENSDTYQAVQNTTLISNKQHASLSAANLVNRVPLTLLTVECFLVLNIPTLPMFWKAM